MALIPALTTISGEISAAPHNNNYSAIRTYVNTYAAFQDQSATITGAWSFSTSPTFPAAVTFALGATVTAGGLVVTAGGLTVTAGGLTVSASGITVTGNSTITGTLGGISTLTATTFSGSGASLTNLPAANLTGTLPAISGANLTALNGSNIASGTVAAARIATALGSHSFTDIDTGGLELTGNGTLTFSATNPIESVAIDFNQYQVVAGSNTPDSTDNTCPVNTQSGTKWIKVSIDGAVGYMWVVME